MILQQELHKKRKKQASGLTLKQEERMETVLTKALGVNVKFKKPSKMLEAALNALSLDFGKLQAKVNKVFEIGRKENYPDMEIGDMVREKMKEEYSDRTISRVLPETAKHIEKIRDTTRFADILSANKHETFKPVGKSPEILKAWKESHEPENEQEASITDPHRFFREQIAQKNEEISGLKTQLAQANKRIAELESEVKRLKK
jgi:hypothetical protein